MRKMKVVMLLLWLCACVSACGQKGPLYLPQPDKPGPEQGTRDTQATEKPMS